MTPRAVDRLLRRIAATEPDEISCSECFELLPGAVEAELAGVAPGPRHARLPQHLDQCPACREEYEVLRELVRAAPEDPRGAGAVPPAPPDPAG